MGKRIISQRRGRGTTTYRAHSFRWNYEVKHRLFDQKERESAITGKIKDIINSKGHSAPLAQISYENNEINYIFAPEKIKVNNTVQSGVKAQPQIGNTLPLKSIPEGTDIFNIETQPGDGGKLCRAAGSSAKLVTNYINISVIKLPSKKQKRLNPNCRATIGVIAGSGRKDKPIVKAGKRHHMMRARGKLYPRTSGVAMNAVDHPFGSGRGRQHAKVKPASRFAPPGRKVGQLRARRSGKKN